MMPLLTKPTTMTVVALELWMMAVTHRPRKNPLRGLSVSLLRIFCRWPAGLFLKGFAHDVHAEQEQSQTAQQRKDIE